jgi:hypothetical protein
MEDLDMDLFDKKKKMVTKNKLKSSDQKENFISALDSILKSFEPVSIGLREYMLKGDQSFKGLMNYCYEGLEEPTGLDASEEIFSGKDPLEIIEISIEKIMNFSIDFFN